MEEKKVIIGITGHSGSGKGTVASDFAEKQNGQKLNYSDAFRDVLDVLYLPQTRENIDTLSKSLRDAYGQDILERVIVEKISSSVVNLFCLEGVRRPADFAKLKEKHQFILVFVDVPLETRHKRIVERAENPGDAEKTLEEFILDQKADAQTCIESLKDNADYVILNDGTLNDLHEKVDVIIKEITS